MDVLGDGGGDPHDKPPIHPPCPQGWPERLPLIAPEHRQEVLDSIGAKEWVLPFVEAAPGGQAMLDIDLHLELLILLIGVHRT